MSEYTVVSGRTRCPLSLSLWTFSLSSYTHTILIVYMTSFCLPFIHTQTLSHTLLLSLVHPPLSFSIILSLSHFIGLYDWRRSLEWKFEDSEKQISKFYFKKKKQILNILTSLTSQEMASKSTSLEKVNFE